MKQVKICQNRLSWRKVVILILKKHYSWFKLAYMCLQKGKKGKNVLIT